MRVRMEWRARASRWRQGRVRICQPEADSCVWWAGTTRCTVARILCLTAETICETVDLNLETAYSPNIPRVVALPRPEPIHPGGGGRGLTHPPPPAEKSPKTTENNRQPQHENHSLTGSQAGLNFGAATSLAAPTHPPPLSNPPPMT